MPGIYVHIPFCRQACNYCDFHFSTNLNNKQVVVNTILREIELRKSYLGTDRIDSIYFGGGTPSLLHAGDLAAIMTKLSNFYSWQDGAEITLEANPDDISGASLDEWKRIGINRLSIGLQSFKDEELVWMNRAHTARESMDSVKLAQDYGFENISIDLIYGSKFQDLASWENTLQTAIDLRTQHISSYNLTIENKTVLGSGFRKGTEPAINEELSSRQFLMMLEILERAKFVQYEISNFGKPGYFAVHNGNYWRQENYLGLGPSAHSFDGSSRQWNIKNNQLYVKKISDGLDFFEKEILTTKDRYNEYVLTRLRTSWGCELHEISQLFGDEILNHFNKQLKPHQAFFAEANGSVILNREGKLRADGIASDLFL